MEKLTAAHNRRAVSVPIQEFREPLSRKLPRGLDRQLRRKICATFTALGGVPTDPSGIGCKKVATQIATAKHFANDLVEGFLTGC